MKPKGSLQCAQKSSTGLHSEPLHSITHYFSKINFNLSSNQRLNLLPWGFPISILYTVLNFIIRVLRIPFFLI
jgi:uncharacterized membrane protein